MRIRDGLRVGALLVCLFGSVEAARSFASPTDPMLEDGEAFSHTPWTQQASVLAKSGATLHPPIATQAAVNHGVDVFNQIDDPADFENGVLRYEEAILRFDHYGTVRYAFLPTGYTIDDDFNTLDPDKLMVDMMSKDCSCHPILWERKPAYDSTRHIVTWMVREHWANEGEFGDTAYADIYMRTGHEYVTANTRRSTPEATWAELQAGIAALSVPAGSRYEDFQSGDANDGPHIAELTSIDASPGEVRTP